jgi:hypothetical protein
MILYSALIGQLKLWVGVCNLIHFAIHIVISSFKKRILESENPETVFAYCYLKKLQGQLRVVIQKNCKASYEWRYKFYS